jgi:hypothetical protein
MEIGELKIAKRECGNCTACCYAPEIKTKPYEKRHFTNCKFCTKTGCSIYEERPDLCKDFSCDWQRKILDEDKKPNEIGVLTYIRNLSYGKCMICFEIEEGSFKKDKFKEIINFCLENNIYLLCFSKDKDPIYYFKRKDLRKRPKNIEYTFGKFAEVRDISELFG